MLSASASKLNEPFWGIQMTIIGQKVDKEVIDVVDGTKNKSYFGFTQFWLKHWVWVLGGCVGNFVMVMQILLS